MHWGSFQITIDAEGASKPSRIHHDICTSR
ncbi:hypothetical protein [Phyllobacterium ifriqiyense]